MESPTGPTVGPIRGGGGEADHRYRHETGAEFLLLVEDDDVPVSRMNVATEGSEAAFRFAIPDRSHDAASDARMLWNAAVGGNGTTSPQPGADAEAAMSVQTTERTTSLGEAQSSRSDPSVSGANHPPIQLRWTGPRSGESRIAEAEPTGTQVQEPGQHGGLIRNPAGQEVSGYFTPAGQELTRARSARDSVAPESGPQFDGGSRAENTFAATSAALSTPPATPEAEEQGALATYTGGRSTTVPEAPFATSLVFPLLGQGWASSPDVSHLAFGEVKAGATSEPADLHSGSEQDESVDRNGPLREGTATSLAAVPAGVPSSDQMFRQPASNPADESTGAWKSGLFDRTRETPPLEFRTPPSDKYTAFGSFDRSLGPSNAPGALEQPAVTNRLSPSMDAAHRTGEGLTTARAVEGDASSRSNDAPSATLTAYGATGVRDLGASGQFANVDFPPMQTTMPQFDDGAYVLPASDLDMSSRSSEPTPSAAGSPFSGGLNRNVAKQIVAAVRADNDGRLELQLSPEELGKVRLSLHVADNTINVVILADRPETIDLMRRHADILQREFRESGFSSMSFTFGQGSADDRSHRSPGAVAPDPEQAPTYPLPGNLPVGVNAGQSSSRLDLRI